MATFEPLVKWQRLSRKSDRALAALIGVSHSTISRARRGIRPLSMVDQLALQDITGITPAEWAEFYAEVVKARTPAPEGKAQKKIPGAERKSAAAEPGAV